MKCARTPRHHRPPPRQRGSASRCCSGEAHTLSDRGLRFHARLNTWRLKYQYASTRWASTRSLRGSSRRTEPSDSRIGQVQPRRVLVEEVVERGTLAEDYKCHCFNGRTHFAQIDFSRHGSNDSHTQALFDREGRLTPFRMVEFVTPADPVAAVAHRVGDDEWAALVAACDRLAGPVHDYIRVDLT